MVGVKTNDLYTTVFACKQYEPKGTFCQKNENAVTASTQPKCVALMNYQKVLFALDSIFTNQLNSVNLSLVAKAAKMLYA